MDTWAHGHMDTWTHKGHMDIWTYGHTDTWRTHGQLETWTHAGHMDREDTWRMHGNTEDTWKATFLVTWKLAHALPCGNRPYFKPLNVNKN